MAVPHSGLPAPDPVPQDATVDDLIAATLTVTGASTLAAVTATSVSAPHSGLTGVTADQHHTQSHGHTGADGSGTVAHSATTGQTANDHHAQSHVVTGADHTASGLTAGHVLRATGATTFAFGAIDDADVPATIARDTEVTSAVTTHEGAADPHAGYQKESEKAAANGYASLDASILVPIAQVPTGTTSTTVSLGDHGHSAVGARAFNTAAQVITTSLITAITLNSERFDTSGFHDTATNTSRMTVPAGLGGMYVISGSLEWAAGATGQRAIFLRLNGTTDLAGSRHDAAAASVTTHTISTIYQLAATDYVELVVFHTQGADLSTAAAGNRSPELSLFRIGA